MFLLFFFFFFQAEDGIRDLTVTGVQTCALPIFSGEGTDRGNSAVWIPQDVRRGVWRRRDRRCALLNLAGIAYRPGASPSNDRGPRRGGLTACSRCAPASTCPAAATRTARAARDPPLYGASSVPSRCRRRTPLRRSDPIPRALSHRRSRSPCRGCRHREPATSPPRVASAGRAR